MSFAKKIALSVLLSTFLSAGSYAQSQEWHSPENRIYLSTGYFENATNSNEGMAYFPLSVYETYNWGFQKLSVDGSGFSRFVSWLIGGNILPIYVSGVLNTSFHEYGHATRFRYNGFNDITYRPNDSSTTTTSFFQMVFDRLGAPVDNASTSANGYTNIYITQNREVDTVITAGGMNNEILLSKLMSERIHERGGSVPDLSYYLLAKLSPYAYSGLDSRSGDPYLLEQNYSALGKQITRTDFKNYYLFSALASGTFFSLVWGNIDYLANGTQLIKPLTIAGFSLPDFYTYLNAKGLSTEAILHYDVNENIKLGLSYEQIFKGEEYKQISPEVIYKVKNQKGFLKAFSIKPQLVLGFNSSQVDLGGSVLTEVTSQYDVGMFLKYTYYNKNTLYGERNITFASSANELLAGAFYIF
ncbi:hypothetical protein [Fluviispira sanaruensis]|uniref:Uncharacterized protein n=1 Tax=Fluviispira sanaruensis TaxID=2493639 RepID=A0A4V0P2P3_FLUSA|nr:hypothetical protein [Fluviispira sanaruensis]BBH53927.1 hypothetical protein JCM31447_23800 [Fluviispira sanaruensis]